MPDKICCRCLRPLPLSGFYRSRYTKDGLKAFCKECADEDIKRRDKKERPCVNCGVLFIGRQCVPCRRKRQAERRLEKPEEVRTEKAAYYQRHREELIAKQAKLRNDDPEAYRAQQRARYRKDPQRKLKTVRRSILKNKFGLSEEQYFAMIEAQQNKCAICWRPPRDGFNCLRIDHCHQSGKVRGLLCLQCNTAIGMFDDDPDILMRAIEYLLKHRT